MPAAAFFSSAMRSRLFHTLNPGIIILLAFLSAIAGWHMVPAPAPPKAPPLAPATISPPPAPVLVSEAPASPVSPSQSVAAGQPSSASPPPAHQPVRRVPLQAGAQGLFARVRRGAAPSFSGVVEVDPALPGHTISGSGLSVQVERSYPPSGGTGTGAELDVLITPAVGGAASQAPLWTEAYSRVGRGFTEEERLFRAKWGWAAYDAALRLAFSAASSSAPVP